MYREMVAGLILKDRKLLLVHNTKYGGLRIEPPGGKKLAEETWKEAVVREVHEELGIDVVPKKLLGIYKTQSPEGVFSVHMYFCEVVKGEPQVMEPDKVSDFGWYPFGDILQLKNEGSLVPNMCDAVRDLRPYML